MLPLQAAACLFEALPPRFVEGSQGVLLASSFLAGAGGGVARPADEGRGGRLPHLEEDAARGEEAAEG